MRKEYFGFTYTTLNGIVYKVFSNGKVTFLNGTTISEDGGVEALKDWYRDTHLLDF